MIIQKHIRKKAEGFGKLSPVFLEAADYALNHQWISVDEDLPCNHEELMSKYPFGYKKKTVNVLTFLPNGNVVKDSMGYREKWWNGRQWDGEKWEWESLRKPTHWFPIPKLPKE